MKYAISLLMLTLFIACEENPVQPPIVSSSQNHLEGAWSVKLLAKDTVAGNLQIREKQQGLDRVVEGEFFYSGTRIALKGLWYGSEMANEKSANPTFVLHEVCNVGNTKTLNGWVDMKFSKIWGTYQGVMFKGEKL